MIERSNSERLSAARRVAEDVILDRLDRSKKFRCATAAFALAAGVSGGLTAWHGEVVASSLSATTIIGAATSACVERRRAVKQADQSVAVYHQQHSFIAGYANNPYLRTELVIGVTETSMNNVVDDHARQSSLQKSAEYSLIAASPLLSGSFAAFAGMAVKASTEIDQVFDQAALIVTAVIPSLALIGYMSYSDWQAANATENQYLRQLDNVEGKLA